MVMVAFGPEHLTVTMNGHTVEGWANVADYFMPPQATEFWSVKTGPTGDAFYFRRGASRGGEVKIVLMPHSPSVTFFRPADTGRGCWRIRGMERQRPQQRQREVTDL